MTIKTYFRDIVIFLAQMLDTNCTFLIFVVTFKNRSDDLQTAWEMTVQCTHICTEFYTN